jgi:hypothetical protein
LPCIVAAAVVAAAPASFPFLLPSPPIAVCFFLPAFHDLGLLLILRRFDLVSEQRDQT